MVILKCLFLCSGAIHLVYWTVEQQPLQALLSWSILCDSVELWQPIDKDLGCLIYNWVRDCLLKHWGRQTHICISNRTIIGLDNGLSPGRHQAIIWTNAGIFLIGPFGTNFSEISNKILTSSFKKMHLKLASAKWRPFCLGLNVLKIGNQRSSSSKGCQGDLSYSAKMLYDTFIIYVMLKNLLCCSAHEIILYQYQNGQISSLNRLR